MHKPHITMLPATADRVIIALNPKAGGGGAMSRVHQFVGELAIGGLTVSIEHDLAAAVAQAETAFAAGRLRAFVAAGGDGTAQEIVNRTSPGLPIAILPLGTENLLAKSLRLTDGPHEAALAVSGGQVARLDVGMANDRIFLLHVGVGFDAEVVRRVAAERTGNISHFTYIMPILQAIQSYEYPEFRVQIFDSREPADNSHVADCSESGDHDSPPRPAPQLPPTTIQVRWAFVMNLARYAAGLPLTPQASGYDGLLDLCAFQQGSFQHGLWYLYNVMLGQHHKLDDCITRQATRLRIESDSPTPYQLDGDPGGQLPVEIRVLPQRFSVLVSPAWVVAQASVDG